MATRVVVIGGGVGGLTAAHELIERGFEVEVFESRPDFGGKARSQPVVGTGAGGRADLPGEHGFRFYPRFYRHVIDTMARIPSGTGTGYVADHLKPTTEAAIAMVDDSTWYRFNRKHLDTPYAVLESLEIFFQDLDFDQYDVSIFTAKLAEFASACDARRLAEYEQLSWWEFLEADRCSPKFQKQLRGIPRMMVAMDSQRGSAHTIGVITLQLLRDFAFAGAQNDRTMGGPTTRMWIQPWTDYLTSRGTVMHQGDPVVELQVAAGKISGVRLASGPTITADYYVLAVPLDAAIGLLSPAVGALDSKLDTLRQQDPANLVNWMVGIQYYLYEDVPLVKGHLFFPDSPWALTAISQPQFWRDLGIFRRIYGDGSVGGLISVDISEWDTPGAFNPKTAKECTPTEIADEVWMQLKTALNGLGEGGTVLSDELLHSWHLDDDLDFTVSPIGNSSRLLVHPPGSWGLRPDAGTAIPNLVLASDYVRTNTNIASMEGACEAGRRAVNEILTRSGSTTRKADVWPLEEPQFAWLKAWDAQRFAAGKPHILRSLGLQRAIAFIAFLRKVDLFFGGDRRDDFLDKLKLTAAIKWIARKFGVTP